MRRWRRSGFWALLLTLAAGRAGAQNRLAQANGNGAYGPVPSHDNPEADARLMAGTLRDSGFSVTLATDTTLAALTCAIAQFGRDLRKAGP